MDEPHSIALSQTSPASTAQASVDQLFDIDSDTDITDRSSKSTMSVATVLVSVYYF